MKSTEDPTSVDEALDRYWLDRSLPGHCPDYAGFDDWVMRRLGPKKGSPEHPFAYRQVNLLLEMNRFIERCKDETV